jgi:hypothetical protein
MTAQLPIEISGGSPPEPTTAVELRPLFLLLVLDGAVGIWSSLHAPALQRFFISQIPLAGLVGLIWGFLEADLKSVVAARIASVLRNPIAYWSIAAFSILFFIVTLVRSTVEIRALDPTSSEVLFVVAGGPRDLPPATPAIDSAICANAAGGDTNIHRITSLAGSTPAPLDSELLNRLTTPVNFGLWILPVGREVWFYTSTHASARSTRVWPWWRPSLQYPDEFDEVPRVHALPLFPLFRGLPTGCSLAFIVREHDSGGTLLAADTLSSLAGLQLVLRDSMPLDTLSRRRWDDSLRLRTRRAAIADAERSGAAPPDSSALAQNDLTGAPGRATLVTRWSAYRLVNTRRPLHVGERIYWEVRGLHRAIVASGEVVLTHETDILLSSP